MDMTKEERDARLARIMLDPENRKGLNEATDMLIRLFDPEFPGIGTLIMHNDGFTSMLPICTDEGTASSIVWRTANQLYIINTAGAPKRDAYN